MIMLTTVKDNIAFLVVIYYLKFKISFLAIRKSVNIENYREGKNNLYFSTEL